MGNIVWIAFLVLPASFWLGEARPVLNKAIFTTAFHVIDGFAHEIVDNIENLPDVQDIAFEPLRKIMEILMQLSLADDMGLQSRERSSGKKRKSDDE